MLKNVRTIKKNRQGVKRFYIPNIDRINTDTQLITKLKLLGQLLRTVDIGIVATCDLVNLPIEYSLYYKGRVAYTPPLPKLEMKVKNVDQVNFLIRPSEFGILSLEDGTNPESIVLQAILQNNGLPCASSFGCARL